MQNVENFGLDILFIEEKSDENQQKEILNEKGGFDVNTVENQERNEIEEYRKEAQEKTAEFTNIETARKSTAASSKHR